MFTYYLRSGIRNFHAMASIGGVFFFPLSYFEREAGGALLLSSWLDGPEVRVYSAGRAEQAVELLLDPL